MYMYIHKNVQCMYMYMYTCTVYIHVYSTLANLVIKKENPDPIHHTQAVQTRKHKMTRTYMHMYMYMHMHMYMYMCEPLCGLAELCVSPTSCRGLPGLSLILEPMPVSLWPTTASVVAVVTSRLSSPSCRVSVASSVD